MTNQNPQEDRRSIFEILIEKFNEPGERESELEHPKISAKLMQEYRRSNGKLNDAEKAIALTYFMNDMDYAIGQNINCIEKILKTKPDTPENREFLLEASRYNQRTIQDIRKAGYFQLEEQNAVYLDKIFKIAANLKKDAYFRSEFGEYYDEALTYDKRLKEAIASENYEEAAIIRDRIAGLALISIASRKLEKKV